jgi:transketolase C-terminal domain/subunit
VSWDGRGSSLAGRVKVVREGSIISILADMQMVYSSLAATDQIEDEDLLAVVIELG